MAIILARFPYRARNPCYLLQPLDQHRPDIRRRLLRRASVPRSRPCGACPSWHYQNNLKAPALDEEGAQLCCNPPASFLCRRLYQHTFRCFDCVLQLIHKEDRVTDACGIVFQHLGSDQHAIQRATQASYAFEMVVYLHSLPPSPSFITLFDYKSIELTHTFVNSV